MRKTERQATPSRWIVRGLAVVTVPMLIAGSSTGAGADAGRSSDSSLAGAPSLVRVTETSKWSPPSPDPSGVEYAAASHTLLVSDGEVDETPLFSGVNVFRTTAFGVPWATHGTIPWSDEPTGIAINPVNDHVFFADDSGSKSVYEVHVGPDGQYGSADDTVTSFATSPFGSTDPEGLAFGSGRLFISDGLGAEVYVINPGPNGAFEGGGDDLVTHWDTASLGQPDPEGIAFNGDLGTLFLISNRAKWDVSHVTTQGSLVEHIELSFISTRSPAGLAYGPGSDDDPSRRVLYLTDRGRDSGPAVTNNDGALFEILLGQTGSPQLYLKAGRRKVQPGDRPRLVARILPCPGHESEVIAFYRRGRKMASKASNAACVARVRVRMWKTSSFRAGQPEVGFSNRVRIRVK